MTSKRILSLLLLSPFILHSKILQNPVLKFVDGIVLDGESFRDLLQIRKRGRELQFGIRDKNGHFEGDYFYQEQKYSIHQLAQIELEIDNELAHTLDLLDQEYIDIQAYEQEWQHMEQQLKAGHEHKIKGIENDQNLKEIDKLKNVRKERLRFFDTLNAKKEEIKRKYIQSDRLEEYDKKVIDLKQLHSQKIKALHEDFLRAKEDYKRVNAPYLDRVRGAKELLLHLTFESCQIHGRDGVDGKSMSFLLEWAEVRNGEEFASFDKSIKTYQQFDQLLTDGSNFYADLIESCPKGKKQCEDFIKKQQQQQANAR